MDPLFAFAVKEEILRNVLKTHRTLLLSGWHGTGKTTTALKTGLETGGVAYCSEAGNGIPFPVDQDKEDIVVVRGFSERESAPPDRLLIVDDVTQVTPPLVSLLGDEGDGRKVIIITTVLVAVKELLSRVDAVVRFKHTTAELLHSRLHDLHARN
ncbi:MAG: hypothetical protein K8I29_06525 [Alphaproteobacteria bacterium]|uniref:Uncharacterized protein n=1 Tax=Candidatus Nitrobium versatile TaxID=2884831 RepID=A0A953JDQ3_9BACT|nr:hypothetical protein [Candidatus Nitrobium versatile]